MNSSTLLPADIYKAISTYFHFPEKLLFGAVATIKDLQPRIRMMRIYDINNEGCPILLTHTASNKWKELSGNPHISINLVSENRQVQITLAGKAHVESHKGSAAKYYWSLVRPDVKKIYDARHMVGDFFCQNEGLAIPQDVPSTFGIVCVIPTFWEVLCLESEYTNSKRYQYLLIDNQWQKKRIQVG